MYYYSNKKYKKERILGYAIEDPILGASLP